VSDEDYTELRGEELRSFMNQDPVARCSDCGRKTWDADSVGEACDFPQPDGTRCTGRFEPHSGQPGDQGR
jgi:hypothetical protein